MDIDWNRRRIGAAAFAVLLTAGAGVALARTTHRSDGASNASSLGAPSLRSVAPTPGVPAAQQDAKSSSVAAGTAAGAANGAPTPVGPPVSAPPPAAPTGPQVVRTAELQMQVRGAFDAAVDRATSLATELGGFVTTSSTASVDGHENGDLTMRIPAARFDEARRRLGDLGTVESSRIGGTDVGGQLVDLDARLRTLRTEEDALDTLLGRSTEIGQILQVRDRLSGVRTEIEQLAGQQASLKDQVALATIHVALHEPGATPTPKPEPANRAWDLGRSLTTSVHAALAVVGGMVIVVGALLPLLVLALLALPFVLRHRRRAHAV